LGGRVEIPDCWVRDDVDPRVDRRTCGERASPATPSALDELAVEVLVATRGLTSG
jgi:hypothetical protein